MADNKQMKPTYNPASITIVKNSNEVGECAANKFISAIRRVPDAVIILPTGVTPLPMYKSIVDKFERDRTLNLSKIKIFNLDEYIGLPPDHPLSYSYYMNKVFYERLDKIDKRRSPRKENRHVPYVKKRQNPPNAAKEYESSLLKAVKSTGRLKADLVVLGIGGAYPVKDRKGKYVGLKGGHIGFNEPGSRATDRTRVVRLSQKTKLDTAFRFLNLRFCEDIYKKEFSCDAPDYAITLGIANILDSREILLLACMEEKGFVIREAYENNPNPDFPATFLKYHNNAYWILDRDAANGLPHIRAPWQITKDATKWNKELMRKAVIEVLNVHLRKKIKILDDNHLVGLGVPERVIKSFGGIDKIAEDSASFLSHFIHSNARPLLPQRKKIVIFSPHPDDDVIDMAGTTKKLLETGNDIWIVYMVNGENSVRNTHKAAAAKYTKLADEVKKKIKIDEDIRQELLRKVRIEVRRDESKAAARIIGVPENKLIFLDLPYYYHRGLIDVPPIDDERDVRKVRDLLLQVRPEHIFYSAEADPHGAHGLCAEIICRALEGVICFWRADFWGYRGAYEEWPIYKCEDLVIVPLEEKEMKLKIRAIQAHASQLNPLFPSFDNREFYERARDRNHNTGRILEQLGYLKGYGRHYAEVFRRIAHSEFIRTR